MNAFSFRFFAAFTELIIGNGVFTWNGEDGRKGRRRRNNCRNEKEEEKEEEEEEEENRMSAVFKCRRYVNVD